MGLLGGSLKRAVKRLTKGSIATRLLGAFIFLAAFGGLAWQIENYRGARSLALAKARLADEIMSWDWRDYHRKPRVPSKRNLAHQPPFNALDVFPAGLGYGVDLGGAVEPLFEGLPPELLEESPERVLQATRHLEAQIQQLHDALLFEECEWKPLDYDRFNTAPVPQLSDLTKANKKLGDLLATRAEAYLDRSDPDKAARDLLVIIKFTDITRFEPGLVGALIRTSSSQQTLSNLRWHRLLMHPNWNDGALLRLQQAIAPIDLLGHFKWAIEAELASAIGAVTAAMNKEPWMTRNWHVGVRVDLREKAPNQWLSTLYQDFQAYVYSNLPRFMPRGWHGQNGAKVIDWWEKNLLSTYDEKTRRIHLKPKGNSEDDLPKAALNPYNFLAKLLTPQFTDFVISISESQTKWDLLRLTCALQRYHLQHNAYPENLEMLVDGKLIPQLPHDYATGEPPAYEKLSQTFSLASLKWKTEGDYVCQIPGE